MFLILTLIVLVAALNIISGLIMLVKDKGRDIAILRTMGATARRDHAHLLHHRRQHRHRRHARGLRPRRARLPQHRAICASSIGWITGTDLFSPELYYLSQLPAEMDAGETASVVIMALVLSFLATLYPSWRAARLDPVEALRYE